MAKETQTLASIPEDAKLGPDWGEHADDTVEEYASKLWTRGLVGGRKEGLRKAADVLYAEAGRLWNAKKEHDATLLRNWADTIVDLISK